MEIDLVLRENIVKVRFNKVDGTERLMLCTLIPDFLPATSGNSLGRTDIVTVFDLEKDQWRSFRRDSIIDYEVVQKD